MARAVWTPIAESELDDILFYIALVDRKPATGERIYYEIRDRVAEHTAQGLPGQKHPDAPENWLYLRHKNGGSSSTNLILRASKSSVSSIAFVTCRVSFEADT
jgi:plasmid stabilization system protein ParE